MNIHYSWDKRQNPDKLLNTVHRNKLMTHPMTELIDDEIVSLLCKLKSKIDYGYSTRSGMRIPLIPI